MASWRDRMNSDPDEARWRLSYEVAQKQISEREKHWRDWFASQKSSLFSNREEFFAAVADFCVAPASLEFAGAAIYAPRHVEKETTLVAEIIRHHSNAPKQLPTELTLQNTEHPVARAWLRGCSQRTVSFLCAPIFDTITQPSRVLALQLHSFTNRILDNAELFPNQFHDAIQAHLEQVAADLSH